MPTSIEDPSYRDPFHTRIRRAKSWLDSAKSERACGDLESGHWDIAFVLYWIAFNAAFAIDVLKYPNTRDEFSECFRKILPLDKGRVIYRALRDESHGAAEEMVSNKYLFKKYWDYVNGKPGNHDWEECLKSDLRRFKKAMVRPSEKSTKEAILILFARLYTLRNQIVHGGATWRSEYNRTSLQHGVPIMAVLVPVFIHIIEQHPREKWGTPYYRPGLRGRRHPE